MSEGPVQPAVIALVAAMALGCDRTVVPERDRLADLRRSASTGVGTFQGRVRTQDSARRCSRRGDSLPGVLVEVGLWDGSPAFYRDTVTGEPPSRVDEPRFQLLASTVTDEEGRFRFEKMPRKVGYAMRAVPPQASPWRLAYGESMYGVPGGADLADFPTLCVPAVSGVSR